MGTEPAVELQPATQDDWEACRAIDRWPEERLLRRKIDAEEVLFPIVEGARAGYLKMGWLWSWYPFIELIVVDEEHRRRGVGRAVVDALTELHRAGRARWLISSTEVHAADSLAWHEAVGFERFGEMRNINWDGSDEVLLRRSIG